MNIMKKKHSQIPKTKIAQTYKSIRVLQARAMPSTKNMSLQIDTSSILILKKNQKNQSQIKEVLFVQDSFQESKPKLSKTEQSFQTFESKNPPLLDKIAILLQKQPSLDILHQSVYKKIKFKSRLPPIERENTMPELNPDQSLTVHKLSPEYVRSLFLVSEKQKQKFRMQNLESPIHPQFLIRRDVSQTKPERKVFPKLEKVPKRTPLKKKLLNIANDREENKLLIRGESSFFLKEDNSDQVDEFVNYVRKSKELSPC